MFKITTTVSLALSALAMQADEQDHMLNDMFAMYVAKYGKNYATNEEWAHRKNLFKETHREITNINSNGSTHHANHNMFSDWTHEEYKRLLGTWNKSKIISNGSYKQELKAPKWLSTDNLPEEVDWMKKGGVT